MSLRTSAVIEPQQPTPPVLSEQQAPTVKQTAISIRGLWKVYGKDPHQVMRPAVSGKTKAELQAEFDCVVALREITFDVARGETFVVMGLSGSGKSTLIRCINRLIAPTAGEVSIDGENIVRLSGGRLRELRRTKLSMVFQHFALFPHMTVGENVEYGLKVQGHNRHERRRKAGEALALVGLTAWADSFPDQLSGGMQQRVGLARALATDADILLMDEAFSALDPLIRREMQDELIRLQQTFHKTIVFITHDLNEALKLGDRVAVMKDGSIVQIGTPEQIVSVPADSYVAAFTQDVDRGRVMSVASVLRQAEVLTLGVDTVQDALFRMRNLNVDALYLVDENETPAGLILESELIRALRSGTTDLSAIMRTDFPKVPMRASLADTYSLCTTGMPIAVVNDDGKLEGILDQLDVLSTLSANNGEQAARF